MFAISDCDINHGQYRMVRRHPEAMYWPYDGRLTTSLVGVYIGPVPASVSLLAVPLIANPSESGVVDVVALTAILETTFSEYAADLSRETMDVPLALPNAFVEFVNCCNTGPGLSVAVINPTPSGNETALSRFV
jgi:hypothetical protein